MGIAASTYVNMNRGKDVEAFVPDAFMPKFGRMPEPEAPQTVGEQVRLIRLINTGLGGRVVRKQAA